MSTFLTSIDYVDFKKKLSLLYLLNVLDFLGTILLLKTGLFSELNGFMRFLLERPALNVLCKLLLPIALCLYLYYRIQSATQTEKKIATFALDGILIFYALVNLSHLLYTGLFVYTELFIL